MNDSKKQTGRRLDLTRGTCRFCGASFKPNQPAQWRQLYCSYKCCMKAWRRRRGCASYSDSCGTCDAPINRREKKQHAQHCSFKCAKAARYTKRRIRRLHEIQS